MTRLMLILSTFYFQITWGEEEELERNMLLEGLEGLAALYPRAVRAKPGA